MGSGALEPASGRVLTSRAHGATIPWLRSRLDTYGVSADAALADAAVIAFRCWTRRLSAARVPALAASSATGSCGVARPARRAVIVACFDTHQPRSRARAMPRFAAVIAGWLRAALPAEIAADAAPRCLSGGVLGTWRAMRGAAVLVSTGGSFSSVPGVAAAGERVLSRRTSQATSGSTGGRSFRARTGRCGRHCDDHRDVVATTLGLITT